MAKIIYWSIPAHGHVNPTLPVVQELIQRGHQVIYYNLEEFRAPIERVGAEFCPYPASVLTSSAQFAELLRGGNIARVSLLLMQATQVLLPFALDELEREQPDIVVFDSLALWGMLAARRLHLPSVGSITHFVFDGSEETRPTARDFIFMLGRVLPLFPAFAKIRGTLARDYADVFPRGDIFPCRGDVNLVFTAEALQPKTNMLNASFRFVGASINPATRAGDFPFEQLAAGKPVIYISLGTINNRDTRFYQKAFSAFADYPAQFILSVGKHINIASLGEIPANFIVRSHVPQLAVLQRSDVFITHGGMNSVHEGLYFGVPLVVIPQQFEQYLNGKQVVAKGAGVMLGDTAPYGRFTVKQLRAAAEVMVNSGNYHTKAREIGELLREAGGYGRAADEIEAFARMKDDERLLVSS